MASKSVQGKTSKYSNVVKGVKNSNTPPEEPRIRPEQVVAAFRSFGFVPNDRNHNDIGYWTTRGQSEGAKLMEELHKRRTEINQKEDENKKTQEDKQKSEQDFKDKQDQTNKELLHQQTVGKTAMPRLSDEDIKALFDEYGLPAPDPEWARNHLPNDPKKVRSILEMQRKAADDMLKKHSKNAINSIPEVPKPGSAPIPTGPTQNGGMGGPIAAQGGMTPDASPVTPFFVGDHALIKITNPQNPSSSTLWLADKTKKVLRPVGSDKDLENLFEDPEAARNSITTLSSQSLAPGGPLEGFTPLGQNKGVQPDGSLPNIEFSQGQIQKRYGQQSDPNAENKSLSVLDGLIGNLNKPQ